MKKSLVRGFSLVFGAALTLLVLSGCKTATMAFNEMQPNEQVLSIQRNLTALSYLDKSAIGTMNPETNTAIKAFQRDHQMPEDGRPSASLYVQTGLQVTKANDAAKQSRVAAQVPPVYTNSPARVAANSAGGKSLGATPEAASSCVHARWDGLLSNPADLFDCDEGRAIASLSEGRDLLFDVHAVNFAEGKLIVSTSMRLSKYTANVNSMQKNFSWDKWMQATNVETFTFVCILSGQRASGIRKGAKVKLAVKLINYSRPEARFNCI